MAIFDDLFIAFCRISLLSFKFKFGSSPSNW